MNGALLTICAALAGWLGLRTRSRRPLLLVLAAATAVATTVIPLKSLTDRAAPSVPLPADQTVRLFATLPPAHSTAGYLSGHVVNASTAPDAARGRLPGQIPSRPIASPRAAGRAAPVAATHDTGHATGDRARYHLLPVVPLLRDGIAGLPLGLLLDQHLHRIEPIPDRAQPGSTRPSRTREPTHPNSFDILTGQHGP